MNNTKHTISIERVQYIKQNIQETLKGYNIQYKTNNAK